MTHFAESDKQHSPKTQQQIECFERVLGAVSNERSLANSAAILAWPQAHAEWVRPGIMLYGISPFAESQGQAWDLQPVMCLSSEIIAIRHCQPGDAIGYGSAYVCESEGPVGVVAIGYGDGYPRDAVSGTPVSVRGQIVPSVGTVSMDLMTVDLKTVPDAKVGDPVVLWGKALPIETVAKAVSTIPYELTCAVSKRVPRVFAQ